MELHRNVLYEKQERSQKRERRNEFGRGFILYDYSFFTRITSFLPRGTKVGPRKGCKGGCHHGRWQVGKESKRYLRLLSFELILLMSGSNLFFFVQQDKGRSLCPWARNVACTQTRNNRNSPLLPAENQWREKEACLVRTCTYLPVDCACYIPRNERDKYENQKKKSKAPRLASTDPHKPFVLIWVRATKDRDVGQRSFAFFPSSLSCNARLAMSLVLQHQHFPTYKQLDGDGVTLVYWRFLFLFCALPAWVPADAVFSPTIVREHHWAFMAEIIDDTIPFSEPCKFYKVRDRDGMVVYLCFQENQAPLRENISSGSSFLKNGNTVFVRYAYQRWIKSGDLDFTAGVVVDSRPDFVHVAPCSLSSILEAHESIAAQRVCSFCGAFSIRRCNKCKQPFYCSQTCEMNDSEKHGRFCCILALCAPATDLVCFAAGPVPPRRAPSNATED